MENDNKQTYALHVRSADVTAWIKDLPKKKSPSLYVEVTVDGSAVQKTQIVERKVAPTWNEVFDISGHISSTVSLSIKKDTYPFGGSQIGRVDISLGTLLAACPHDEPATLEVKSVVKPNDVMVGVIIVKLSKGDHLNHMAVELSSLGLSQLHDFQRHGQFSDLESAISNQQKAVELTDDGHPDKPTYLSQLGNSLRNRFVHRGDFADIENAIVNQQKAVELTDDGNPIKSMYLSNLGNSQQSRFKYCGDPADIKNAISNQQKAVDLTDDNHRNKPARLTNLGNSQRTLFEHSGDLADLESAISSHLKAVKLADDGNPEKPSFLTNLGASQLCHFIHRSDSLVELENAISNQGKAVELTNDSELEMSSRLSNLGISQRHRFERLGDLRDLQNAISNQQRAVGLTDDRHSNKAALLLNLSTSQLLCFAGSKDPADIDNAILNSQKAVDLTGPRHSKKPGRLSTLGSSYKTRFGHFGNAADLESAISYHRKAVELVDDRHPDKPSFLSNLGESQRSRFMHFGDLLDLENALESQQMAVLLTGDRYPQKAKYLWDLSHSQQTRFQSLGELADLENAISNRQKVVESFDDRHANKPKHLLDLGCSQAARFRRRGEMVDIDNAISNQQEAVRLLGDRLPGKPSFPSHLGISQLDRFERFGELADLENAISNQRRAVELTANEHPHNQSWYLWSLGTCENARFEHLGNLPDLESAIFNLKQAVAFTGDEDFKQPAFLSSLGNSQATRFQLLGEWGDIDNAISNQQKAVNLARRTYASLPTYLTNLGSCQLDRFVHALVRELADPVDLENAISNQREAVQLTNGHPSQSVYLVNLGNSLYRRFEYLGERSDLVDAVSTFKAAAQLKTAYPRYALLSARRWARISHENDDLPASLDGYRTALEILPKVAWLGLDADSHREWLVREGSENLGCLAATCAIRLGRLEEAVELLDLSRSVFWQQASSLRSDLDLLRKEQPGLAKELEDVGRELDGGKFSDSIRVPEEQTTGINNRENVGKERRRLVGRWESLVEKVREISGFEYFLRPVPFRKLRQAAVTGRVAIINISDYGVDALIFGTTGPIHHVPLPKVNLTKLANLTGNVVLNRSADIRAACDDRATQRRNLITNNLRNTLHIIWHMILVPIFDKIEVPLECGTGLPQHRIWWYPTGPLTFIPIHAAGPDGGDTDVSRMIVSSYVTTLDTLFKAQKAKVSATLKMKLLAISQPETPGESRLPHSTTEVLRVVEAARSAGWSEEDILRLHGSQATTDRVLGALDTSSWIHFACHGSQDLITGTKSAFALHDGHLELGKIASKRLSVAQFAFLSACHAASGLKKLPGEAMHLAAGLQFCGFSSVIATMWGIRDEDAPKVADPVYRYLFRNGVEGLDPSDAATALNRAVLGLRADPTVTLDRWAPFIHFGI